MSPAFARLLAIPFALPAFGLGALEKLWEGPLPVLSANPCRSWHVAPRFIVAAIRHYAEDPTCREEIGTEAEHERPRDALRRQAQPIS